MDHYLTEVGFNILEQQYDLYLNSKVAPDTCNATGLGLGVEPESKTVPLTVMVIAQLQRELPILWSPSGRPLQSKTKQNHSERNLYTPFYKRCKYSHF